MIARPPPCPPEPPIPAARVKAKILASDSAITLIAPLALTVALSTWALIVLLISLMETVAPIPIATPPPWPPATEIATPPPAALIVDASLATSMTSEPAVISLAVIKAFTELLIMLPDPAAAPAKLNPPP